ncbi:sugar ABC transporter ATP-binding protein [Christensenella tenuis]|uniref:Sugar ABC transporter ATP-binding protein n=1 Tax=Christensenella tenuis TaxID=2763033 RepID=A0ABR7ECX0_9FIRM|nr:sugar ABC transporter ATP-binding protein [Christensenella tenuis]MBC5647596.1 sugar ABC transporter ATP-binding protein [Christensenella tenuis]
MGSEYRLQMKGITKQFPGVLALDGVDLEVKAGEVLAVIGENGAGKSTMMKILSGALLNDHGEIYLDGELVPPEKNARERLDLGIAIIYQELNYLDEMTIAENLFMGELPVKGAFKTVDFKKLRKQAQELLNKFDLPYDPFTKVGTLTVAEKQMIEILRAVSKDVKVLVMDEPTSALSETEIEQLYAFIKDLASKGVSILYISHKLDEVFAVTDKIQVMRDGKRVGYLNTKDTTEEELVELMVGRELSDMYPKEEAQIGETVLEVKHLDCEIAHDVSFKVRKGEILGLFGLLGSGRTEAVEGILGKKEMTAGEIYIEGKQVTIKNMIEAKKYGLAYVPASRKDEGLILIQTVRANTSVTVLDQLGAIIDKKKETELIDDWIKKLRIKTPSPDVPVDSLSGGNQQKVVLAKWLAASPKVLIVNEPTRGIDVGAKVEIYKLLEELCQEGIAVIMISSELPETVGIADRILIFKEGEIKGEFDRKDFTQKQILQIAVGGEQ